MQMDGIRAAWVRGVGRLTGDGMLVAALLALSGGSAAEEGVIEEVVVTATKRAVGLQDVPASVTSIGGDELDSRGVLDVEDLSMQVPNLVYGGNGSNGFITLRGIGTTVDSGVAEPAVSTYVDGVFLPRASMATLRQVDMQRVEVIRGPQGTLYGRNATGGAINFVSRAPATEFESGVTLALEDRDGHALSGYVSGPLSDTVAFRLSAGREEQDGYVDVLNTGQELADTDVVYGRLALQVTPSDALTIDLTAQYEKGEAVNGYQALLTPATTFFLPLAPQTTEELKLFADGPHDGEIETTLVSARVNWDLSDTVSLRSITGYVDHEVTTTFDADGTGAFFTDLVDAFRPSESFSQEFNLYGDTGRLSWLVGAYWYEEDFLLTLPVDFAGVGLVIAGNLEEETRSYAFFADLTYSLTDRLRLNAGLRYNDEEKDFTFFDLPGGSLDEDDLLPKLGLQYDLTDDVNVYGAWQRGIKSGGHQLSQPTTFEGEELDAWEAGIKSRLLGGRLTANAAVFFYDYENLQATTVIPPSTTLVQNGDAEVTGFEGELRFLANEQLSFNLGVSLLDSEYTDLLSVDQTDPAGGLVDLSGEELIRAPRYTLNAGVDWTIPVRAWRLENIVVRLDAFHSDDYKLNFFDYGPSQQDAYTTANLSVMANDRSGRFQVRAWVNNLTDEVTLNQANYLAITGAFFGLYSEPRNGGVSVTMRF